ncbi:MAG: cupin domain-containing protein [Chloroflexales bacterium]|nr:cupin domain-containing protein [Chloroflexales bacterium]
MWFLGLPTRVLATAAQTGGGFGLVEHVMPPGAASPWHVHHMEDEAFYVVEGALTFRCGDQELRAGPGTFVYGPREIPHGFRVEGSQAARLLLLCTPGGFEQFIIDLSEPTPPTGPPDLEQMLTLARHYHCDILGPWPG